MNIGLDIDNVITAFDATILKAMAEDDKNKRGNGIVNKNSLHLVHLFDWSDEEIRIFYETKMENLAKILKARKNCKKYMDKLLADGHKIYLISNRIYPNYKSPEKTTLDWLDKHKINYTKLIISKLQDKTEECKQYNIDVMVDDNVRECKNMTNNGINCIVMLTKFNKKRTEGLPSAKSWDDLYRRLSSWQ